MAEYWETLGLTAPPETVGAANEAYSDCSEVLTLKNDSEGLKALQAAYDTAIAALSGSRGVEKPADVENELTLDDFSPHTAAEPDSNTRAHTFGDKYLVTSPKTPQAEESYLIPPEDRIKQTWDDKIPAVKRKQYGRSSFRSDKITISDALGSFFSNVADDKASAPRIEYWSGMAFNAAVHSCFISYWLVWRYFKSLEKSIPLSVFIFLLWGFFALMMMVPNWYVTVRRLNDLGLGKWLYKTYWIILIPVAIIFKGWALVIVALWAWLMCQ